MSINRVVLTGNLTRDPDMRATPSGTQIMQFGVAVNDRRRNQQTGEWEDYPNFIECVLFGTRANALQNYLHKGSKVAVEGKLRWSSWEDKNSGQKRSKIEVVVDDVEFMNARQEGGNYSTGSSQPFVAATPDQAGSDAGVPETTRPVEAPPSAEVFDQDIPF